MKRFQRAIAAAAIAVVAGAGLAVVTSSSASAATLGGVTLSPASGTNGTLFSLNVANAACPAGTIYTQFSVNGSGLVNDATQPGGYGIGGGATPANGIGPITIGGNSIANIATVNAGSFVASGTYIFSFDCFDASFNITDQYINTMTYTAGGAGAFTSAPAVVATATTTTLSASPASPQNAGTSVTFTATVAPAAAAGTVQFSVDGAPVGAPAAVSGGTATFTTSSLAAGARSIGAAFTGASGFSNSVAAPLPYTIVAVPAAATSSTLASVTPNSGPAFQSVTLTGAVANTTTPANIPAGACAFKNGAAAIATVPVTATGSCAFTSTAFAAGTYAFSFDFVPTNPGVFLPSTSNSLPATYSAPTGGCGAAGDVCTDPQTVVVTVPAGNISISTPYTPAAPFNLGTLVLAANGSSYSVSAPFGSAGVPADGVTIVDTRAGALPFTAQIASTNFTNGPASISNSLLGFTGVTPAYVAGNAINAGTNPLTVTNLPAGSISILPATFATGTGPGSVNVFGTLSLSNVPTSTTPGLYTATVTFTLA